ncbi:MAG: 2,3,4,5-tetrahydropyridine-2,6-dicarboxylate N-succinyltransferase, partial [Bacteroidota bacterium]
MSRMSVRQLRDGLEPFLGVPAGAFDREAALPAFLAFREALERGAVRAATRDEAGTWNVHVWVKEGLLLGFRLGRLERQGGDPQPFFDKDTYPVRALTLADQIRVVPGGSAIRTAAYVAPGVVCMPPMYVNVGAYVGEGTMIDSHALVGTCAQVGRRVHLSAAAQLGGVIEPPGALPVIVEDDAFIGGGCGVYEGCIIRAGAVLSAGVILTRSTRVYDLVHERIL